MKQLRNSALLLAILALSACAGNKVAIPDIELFWDAKELGANQTWTVTEETKWLSKAEWDAVRHETVAMRYDGWAQIRGALEKLCSERPVLCSREVRENMKAVFSRVEKAHARRERKP